MASIVGSLIRNATREKGERLNVISFPTHESYQSGLASTNANFYLWRGEGIKNWETKYRQLPKNHHLLDPAKGDDQLPVDINFDCILSQNPAGQYPVAFRLSKQLHLPLVTITHTLPPPGVGPEYLQQIKNMRGDVNVFISEFSRAAWGWGPDEAKVIHHGIDEKLFKPNVRKQREKHVLSVVNDWRNRDWCCFTSGTRIPTIDGQVLNVEDVYEDNVLFASEARQVLKLVRRNYSGFIYSVDFGYGNIHHVTEEHPYITNHGQIEARDLKSDMRIFYIFPKTPDKVDLVDTLDNDTRFSVVNGKIKCVGNNSTEGINRYVECDDDFFDFIGWYLGEGSVTNRNIEFDLSSDEVDIADRLLTYAKSIGVNGFTRPNSRGDSLRVIFTSKPLAQYLSKTFGDCASNKRIPPYFMNVECVKLYESLREADGSENSSRIKYDSKSRNLIECIFMFFAQFSIAGKMSEYTRTGFGVTSELHTLTFNGDRIKRVKRLLTSRDLLPCGIYIKNISKKLVIDEPVYNFQVSDDNLYTTLYGTTHNCGYNIWERITKGLPVKVLGDNPGLSSPAKSLTDLINTYQGALIFLNTSTISPVPTALLEAAACGCAIVSTNTCMIPEIFTNNKDAYLANDEKALRIYLEKLLNDPSLAQKMGDAARRTVQEKFSLGTFVNNWDSVLQEASNLVFKG